MANATFIKVLADVSQYYSHQHTSSKAKMSSLADSLPQLAVRDVHPSGQNVTKVLERRAFRASKSEESTATQSTNSGSEDRTEVDNALHIHFVADPRGGVFSQKKKQCDLWEFVWGSTFVAAELACALVSAYTSAGDGGIGSTIDSSGVERGLELNTRPFGLEMGCGSGVASVCAALAGADMCATDVVRDALRVSAQTAEHNGVRVQYQAGPFARESSEAVAPLSPAGTGTLLYRVFDWHKADDESLLSPRSDLLVTGDDAGRDFSTGFDFILGADVLFFGRAARPVARAAARHLRKSEGSLLVVVDPARGNAEQFCDELYAAEFEVVLHEVREFVAPAGGLCVMRQCEIIVAYWRRNDLKAETVAGHVLEAFVQIPDQPNHSDTTYVLAADVDITDKLSQPVKLDS